MATEEELFHAWFSGFVAGEGCFRIQKHPKGRQFKTNLRLNLRDDDLEILIEIQQRLGMGTLHRISRNLDENSNDRPSAVWETARALDCKRLVEIFDRHPLRAKKQRDFQIWREAVFEINKPVKQRDLEKLRYLSEKLKLVRQYDPVEESIYKPEGIQLTLPDYIEEDE